MPPLGDIHAGISKPQKRSILDRGKPSRTQPARAPASQGPGRVSAGLDLLSAMNTTQKIVLAAGVLLIIVVIILWYLYGYSYELVPVGTTMEANF
jgi:hypothetical protein